MRHRGTVGTAMVQFTKCIVALSSAVCNGLMAYNGAVMISEQRCFGARFKAIASRAMVTAIKGLASKTVEWMMVIGGTALAVQTKFF